MIELPDAARFVPHLDQYFGLWAVDEQRFRAMADHVQRLDLALHIQSKADSPDPPIRRNYDVDRGVATIALSGPLMKQVSSLGAGTSTVFARRQIRNAVRDPEVGAILLLIDSPGGTVAGTADLADEVAAANRQKPVVAYIEDLGASAAYYVASQASKIVANRSALIGSIGTFMVVVDYTGAAAMQGVKVHVIRAGRFKGAGTPGTEITAEQIGYWQTLVDQINDQFIRAVAAGRKMAIAQATELADGRVHLAAIAQQNKLIDGIESFDAAFDALASKAKSILTSSKKRSPKAMSEDIVAAEPADPVRLSAKNVVADYDELIAACPGADAAFLCSQLAAHATGDQASRAWMAEQNRRLAAQQQENEKLRASQKTPGVELALDATAAGPSRRDHGDARAEWLEAIQEKVASGMSRQRAVLAVAHERPELREAVVAAANLKSA